MTDQELMNDPRAQAKFWANTEARAGGCFIWKGNRRLQDDQPLLDITLDGTRHQVRAELEELGWVAEPQLEIPEPGEEGVMNVTFDFGGGHHSVAHHALWVAPGVPPQCLVAWEEDGHATWAVAHWRDLAPVAVADAARECAATVDRRLPPGTDPVVRRWLATGDPALAEAARSASRSAATVAAARSAAWAAEAAAWAAWAAVRARSAADAAAWAVWAAADAARKAATSLWEAEAAVRPFSLHLWALALWEQAPAQTLREVLDRDRHLRYVLPAVAPYWRRVAAELGAECPPEWGQRPVDASRAKLTNAQAREIRSLKERQGLSNPEIAQMYGVSASTIWRIINNKSYREERIG